MFSYRKVILEKFQNGFKKLIFEFIVLLVLFFFFGTGYVFDRKVKHWILSVCHGRGSRVGGLKWAPVHLSTGDTWTHTISMGYYNKTGQYATPLPPPDWYSLYYSLTPFQALCLHGIPYVCLFVCTCVSIVYLCFDTNVRILFIHKARQCIYSHPYYLTVNLTCSINKYLLKEF